MSHAATETAKVPGTADTGRAATWRDRAGGRRLGQYPR